VRVTSSLTDILTPTAAALGNFDGIHLGHRQVIEPVLAHSLPTSDRLPEPTQPPPYPTVVTFNPHPQEFFSGQPRCLLTPLDEKVQLLRAMGVQQLVLLPFDRELASLSPERFVEDILLHQLHIQRVSVGADFCFGRQRSGTATDLKAIAATHGVEVTIAPLKNLQEQRISSSSIRQALQQGDLPLANCLLGRTYCLIGQVIQGQQLGRTLGFPTANLQLPPEKFLPATGVYAVRVHLCQTSDSSDITASPELLGVMNIGSRPTVSGTHVTVEVHLLDWTGDLYGRTLAVFLEKFIRPEQKFPSLDALKTQIQEDSVAARKHLLEKPQR
jgi:riboflavin kinase/FMN adenylyltransferase